MGHMAITGCCLYPGMWPQSLVSTLKATPQGILMPWLSQNLQCLRPQ